MGSYLTIIDNTPDQWQCKIEPTVQAASSTTSVIAIGLIAASVATVSGIGAAAFLTIATIPTAQAGAFLNPPVGLLVALDTPAEVAAAAARANTVVSSTGASAIARAKIFAAEGAVNAARAQAAAAAKAVADHQLPFGPAKRALDSLKRAANHAATTASTANRDLVKYASDLSRTTYHSSKLSDLAADISKQIKMFADVAAEEAVTAKRAAEEASAAFIAKGVALEKAVAVADANVVDAVKTLDAILGKKAGDVKAIGAKAVGATKAAMLRMG